MILYQGDRVIFLKKNIIFLLLSLTILLSNKISTFKVDGMMCISGCVFKVNSVVQSIEGVSNSNVNFEKGILTVKYDSLKVYDTMIINKLSNETTYKVKKTEKDFSKILFNWFKIF